MLTSQGFEAKSSSGGERGPLGEAASAPQSDRELTPSLRPEPLQLEAGAGARAPLGEGAFSGFEHARVDDVVDESAIPKRSPETCEASPTFDESWIGAQKPREQSLLRLILAQDALRAAAAKGAVVELRAAADEWRGSLLPIAATVTINSGDAEEAQANVGGLKNELNALFIHNVLQFLPETRQFLALCFSKLSVGGMMIISVPHQFLYERKLRLPSRRNRLHRRFYTPNTLMADVEEAIDPCEFRVRFLGDSDAGFPYWAGLNASPEGGQDIVLALERIVRPPWRSELDADELWAETATKPVRFLPLDKNQPAPIRIVAPDLHGISRIIVLKLDHRGDFMMATEAFKTLRQAFGSARLTLVCGSWNIAEAQRSGFFDEVVAFDFFPEDDSARQERPPRKTLIAGFARKIEGESYDLAIDLRLYDDSREILQVIDARHRAGFDRYDLFPWLTIRLNIPSATVDDRAETGVITAARFHTSMAEHRTYEIALQQSFRPQDMRTIIWGPYEQLTPGRYQFECLIEPLDGDFEIPYDIVRDSGLRTVAAGVLQAARGGYPRIDLAVDERIPEFEFRLVGSPTFEVRPFRFMGLRFLRASVIRGAHQSEAMALLARLVELRLRNAYTTELE
ncbi:hypothetical protein [Roseiarcus sp.]|uniref:hypothetical protein n=1 Tax=Roseiarcus sp. TaxID=1969460 RepID=UPI003F97416C